MERPRLGDVELDVLRVVWRRGRATVHEVREAFGPERPLAYTTVLTTLRNLERKGYVTHVVAGRSHVFRAVASQDEVARSRLKDLLARLFGGSPVHLVRTLLEEEDLSREEIRELRKRIEDGRRKEGRRG